MRTLLALALGATLAMVLASCAQILGLDENLGPADASTEASTDAGRADSGDDDDHDATTDGGMRGGSDAGDASLVDGADGSGGSDAASNVWQLDKSFGSDGVATLLGGPGAKQPDLELVYVAGTIASFDAGVYAVGVTAAVSQELAFFDLDDPGFAGGSVSLGPANGSDSDRLLGAFATDAGIVALVQDVSTMGVQKAALMEPGQGDPGDVPNPSNVTISRLVQQSSDGAFHGPGTIGNLDTTQGEEVTIESFVVASVVDPQAHVYLAQGVAPGNGTWIGGYDGASLPGAVVLPLNSGLPAIELSAGADTIPLPPSSVTDFAATDTTLYAVGYVGNSFALWPMAAVPSAAPALITPAGAADFVGGRACTLPAALCFVRSAVADDGTIVVSGALGDPYLATFDENGNETRLLAPFGGGSAVSSLDMALVLPHLAEEAQWNAGAVLAQGDYLYASFASSGSGPTWAVVRMQRGTGQ